MAFDMKLFVPQVMGNTLKKQIRVRKFTIGFGLLRVFFSDILFLSLHKMKVGSDKHDYKNSCNKFCLTSSIYSAVTHP